MKIAMGHRMLAASLALAGSSLASREARAGQIDASTVEIHGGMVTFDATTNVPAIGIHGKSTALEGRARIRQTVDGLVIEQLEAGLAVRTLNSGIGLRDEHMRRYVFTTPEGLQPDIRFVAGRVLCSGSDRVRRCQLSGDLIIRETPRPFAIALKVSDDGNSFHVAGDGVVKLSAYGIPPPSQLGVTTTDEVKLHVDFVVKRVEDRLARSTR